MGKIVRNGKIVKVAEKRLELIKNIIRVFNVCEPVIFSMLPVSRMTSQWCQPLRNNPSLLESGLCEVKKIEEFSRWVTDRYYGVNICALRKYGTIEFRYHSGTLDSTKIIMWAKLIERLVLYAKQLTELKYKKSSHWHFANSYNKMLNELQAISVAVTLRGKERAMYDILGSQLAKYVHERIEKFKGAHKQIKINRGVSAMPASRSGFGRLGVER